MPDRTKQTDKLCNLLWALPTPHTFLAVGLDSELPHPHEESTEDLLSLELITCALPILFTIEPKMLD
jgi:hypothetical protein